MAIEDKSHAGSASLPLTPNPSPPRGEGDDAPLARLHTLLKMCATMRGSDLHLSPGLPPYMRVDGILAPLAEMPPISGIETQALARAVLDAYSPSNDALDVRVARKGSIDGALTSPDGSRFRFNFFVSQREFGLAFRRLEDRFRSLKELGIPETLYDFCDLRDGLVAICGPTGAGKSTTLAALLDRINRTRASHVVTIEDPIEYVHKPIKSIISHRQVGTDAPSFNDALVASLRQDPDVVLLGEARDLETIRTAITAAETGHLVFATLHAGDCVSSIERLTAVFPAAEQESIRRQLALVLRAVFAQHLLPAVERSSRSVPANSDAPLASCERVAASELLIVTPAVSNLIMQGKSAQIASIMETGGSLGMQTLDSDLARLWVSGRVSEQAALLTSRNPNAVRDRAALMRRQRAQIPSNAGAAPRTNAGGPPAPQYAGGTAATRLAGGTPAVQVQSSAEGAR
ncbi:MAG TPA: PilT/PilU family type 4a pilus ATPase [Planctomycetota bacterium]|nr:PilT/PilU family type 4a pilus ATPase [Planctomycetota bacterium]